MWLTQWSGMAQESRDQAALYTEHSMQKLKPAGRVPGFYLPIFLQACLMTVKFPSLSFNKREEPCRFALCLKTLQIH